MQLFTKWAGREYPLAQRMAALLLAAIVVLYLLPLGVVRGGSLLDLRLGLPALHLGAANHILGGALMIAGLFFALWSIGDQITRGRGTPLPVMPTQELLTQGRYNRKLWTGMRKKVAYPSGV